jgi:hypothetical protein
MRAKIKILGIDKPTLIALCILSAISISADIRLEMPNVLEGSRTFNNSATPLRLFLQFPRAV